jgi:predicted nucleic acid-binding protein
VGGRCALRAADLSLICDTGVVFAAAVSADRNHGRCRELLESWPDPLVVPATVVVEVDWIANARGVRAVSDGLLRTIETGGLYVEDLATDDYARIRELCRRYDDLPLGLVDASLVALAERLGERSIATLDHRHFSVVRPRHVRALTLLPT